MNRKSLKLFLRVGIISVSVLGANAQAPPEHQEAQVRANSDTLIAIDVLLEPNQAMLDRANATNARLRENYSAGYALDPRTRRMSRCCSATCE